MKNDMRRTRKPKALPQITITPVYAPEQIAVARAAIQAAWVDALVNQLAEGRRDVQQAS